MDGSLTVPSLLRSYAAIFSTLFVVSVWNGPISDARPNWRPTTVSEVLSVNLAIFSVTATAIGYFSFFDHFPRLCLGLGCVLASLGCLLSAAAVYFDQVAVFYIGFGGFAGVGLAMVDMGASQHNLIWGRKKGVAGAFFAFSAGAGSLIMTVVSYFSGTHWDASLMFVTFALIISVTGLPWVYFVTLPIREGSDSAARPLPARKIIFTYGRPPSDLSLRFAMLTRLLFFAGARSCCHQLFSSPLCSVAGAL